MNIWTILILPNKEHEISYVCLLQFLWYIFYSFSVQVFYCLSKVESLYLNEKMSKNYRKEGRKELIKALTLRTSAYSSKFSKRGRTSIFIEFNDSLNTQSSFHFTLTILISLKLFLKLMPNFLYQNARNEAPEDIILVSTLDDSYIYYNWRSIILVL